MASYHLPESESCFQCAWRSLHETKTSIQDITERIPVECEYRKLENANCDRCRVKHYPCERIATLLDGDFRDMFALLCWADDVALQSTDVAVGNTHLRMPLWTDDEKRGIISTELVLMQAFRAVEQDHRVQRSIDVGKRKRANTGSDVRYTACVQQRRDAVFRLYPPPMSPTPAEVRAWENNCRLRLWYGDEHFVTWVLAKIAFVDAVLAMADEKGPFLAVAYRAMLPKGVKVY